MRKKVCGFGINDVDYVINKKVTDSNGNTFKEVCPFYRRWLNMIQRCYSDRPHYTTYKDVSVCEDWRYLSKFKDWMEQQDWEGKHLDKDLLGDGKLYSPETCCFIDNQTNVFIRETIASSQGLSKGVCKDSFPKGKDNNFLIYAQDVTLKKRLHVGYSNTHKLGSKIFTRYMGYYGDILSERYENIRIKTALKNLPKYEVREVPEFMHLFENAVLYFNETFGNKVTDKSLIKVYKDLTKEEVSGKMEMISSYYDEDWEGVLDGLCDTLFTGLMWLNLQGRSLPKEYLKTTDIKGISKYDFKLLEKSLDEDRVEFFQRALIDLSLKVSQISDLEGAFERVYESNMSKLLKNSVNINEDQIKTELEKEGRYSDIFFEEREDGLVVKAKIDLQEGKVYPSGKIMKGWWYKSVEDLGGLEVFLYE